MKDWLWYRARISTGNPALISPDLTLSYGQLNTGVQHLAGQLKSMGVQRGDRVAILPPNIRETVMAVHALARIGAVIVPLNLQLPIQSLDEQLAFCNCKWLLYTDHHALTAASLTRVPAIMVSAISTEPWIDAPVLAPETESEPSGMRLDQQAAIVFTSGSTAGLRGVMLTHGNLYWSAIAAAMRLGTIPEDRWLACLPLYHMGGLSILYRCTIYGSTVVLLDGFDEDRVIAAIRDQQVTQISFVPTMLHRFLEALPQAWEASHLRWILVGGAATPLSLLSRAQEKGVPLATTYGLTETASQVATARPEEVLAKPGSSGKPLMFTELRLVREDGGVCEAGEVGEINVSGPMVMQGYYGQEALTAQRLKNGVLRTGDLGFQDPEGNLWVQHRREDLIVTGGENVFPVEVERVLAEHPDVWAACVVGVPDPIWGQVVAAAVRMKPARSITESQLQTFCRDRLAGYMIPRRIRVIDELPLTGSGKIDRAAVIALFPTSEES